MVKPKTLVQAKHIARGIEHYKGQPDHAVQTHLDRSDWQYTAYRFEDDRILLVYPDETFAILYASDEVLYQEMEKERVRKGNLDLDRLY